MRLRSGRTTSRKFKEADEALRAGRFGNLPVRRAARKERKEMKRDEIRAVNDKIRTQGLFGPDQPSPLFVSPGVLDLGEDVIGALVVKFMQFNEFNEGLDPDGLHDMGEIDMWGDPVWFVIEPHEDGPAVRTISFILPHER
jgi:hypothetical protein